MTPVTYILLAVIVAVILIDLYLKRKNKLATTKDIEKVVDKENPDKKEYNKPIAIVTATLLLLIASFFGVNHQFYDGRLTDTDDGITVLQNITLDKISYADIVVSDSLWVSRSNMQAVSGIVVDSLGNYNGIIIKGLQQGLWRYYYKNNVLKHEINFGRGIYAVVDFETGFLDIDFRNLISFGEEGLERTWYENGQLEFYCYNVNGKMEGVSKRWYENGQLLCELYHSNGESDGIVKYWHENGQLRHEYNYVNGVQTGSDKSWYENGQLKKEGNYKDGKHDGLWKSYHENGQLKKEGNYKDGKHDGLWKSYHENGQLHAEHEFVEGEKNGFSKSWYEEGTLENPIQF